MNVKTKNIYKQHLYRMQKGKCLGCKLKFIPDKLTLDHIFPKSKGGVNKMYNFQLLCRYCNQMKADQLIVDIDKFETWG